MNNLTYRWRWNDSDHQLEMVYVEGTRDRPYQFGEGPEKRAVEVRPFYIATVPVTQALWNHVMGGGNPSHFRGDRRPVENVSWHDITGPGGFLERINAGGFVSEIARNTPALGGAKFRLPSETEWEYAARGGSHWSDGFQFSGGDDIEAVAWYDRNSGPLRELGFWERRPRSTRQLGTETHDVGLKAPNQLGIHDMSGNVWEWCQDAYDTDLAAIPKDGSPFAGTAGERVLRGGCHHNWAIHCTVSKRYQIVADHRDECVGFRLAMSIAGSAI